VPHAASFIFDAGCIHKVFEYALIKYCMYFRAIDHIFLKIKRKMYTSTLERARSTRNRPRRTPRPTGRRRGFQSAPQCAFY